MKRTRKTAIMTLLSVLLFAASIGPIYPAFGRHSYTINAFVEPTSGGEISPAGIVEVPNCKDLTFTISPYAGYRIHALEVDGVLEVVDIYGVASYTFTKVKTDHTIVVIFKENLDITLPENSSAVTEINVLADPPKFLPSIDGTTPYFEVVVTEGTFSGDVIIAILYDDSGLSLEQEQNLRLYIGNPVDFDEDGSVNGNDIALIQKEQQNENPDLAKFDVNHDGIVDILDENIVKEYANSGLIVNPGQDDAGQFRIPWIDITTGVDTDANTIYGETWHLSLFRAR